MLVLEARDFPCLNVKNVFPIQRVDSQESCILAVGHSYGCSISNMKRRGVYLEEWPVFESSVQTFGKFTVLMEL